ncbi:MAG: phosphotransferase, partial [Nitrospinae bacterium]|nr:phosphotransferase [Nitrospinota bacterium]
KKPKLETIEKILSRDDYIDNLKSIIEQESFYTSVKKKLSKREADKMRSLYIIANNLERIADFAVNIVRQTEYLTSYDFINRFNYTDAFKEILGSLKLINKAFEQKDLNLGYRICRAELSLDEFFAFNFEKVMSELRRGGDQTENLVTSLFILRYLERMGDSLLNIGEAIIFSVIGERVKIQHIEGLEGSMGSIDSQESLKDLHIEAILGTKSGCKISRVENEKSEHPVIFKEGKISKIEKEQQNIEKWSNFKPGLPPKVYSYQKNGKSASILLEYLDGPTIQRSLLDPNSYCLKESVALLKKLLVEIWTGTRENTSIRSNFIKQMKARVPDICQAHPDYNLKPRLIGGLVTYSFEELIDECEQLEKKLASPFSVWGHGDFNLDNIIYSPQKKRIHFIDLYRSGRQDYVQDVSVFLVSIFRLPVLAVQIREKMNQFALDFFAFASDFAIKNEDSTFEARLAFGLARSFFTSTRFEFDPEFSQTMQQRALYLMEKVASHGDRPWEDFKLIPKVLTYI